LDIHDTADVFLAPMHAEYQAALDHLKGLLEANQQKG
jgi:hypothetical protein